MDKVFCTVCETEKDRGEFAPSSIRDTSIGRRGRCGVCRRSYRTKHKQRRSEYNRQHSALNPELRTARRNRHRKLHPYRYRARQAVVKALARGRMKREGCVICGCVRAEAHHDNYNERLSVTWLCKGHHAAWHRLFVPDYPVEEGEVA